MKPDQQKYGAIKQGHPGGETKNAIFRQSVVGIEVHGAPIRFTNIFIR
jgi:hypothetical protein